MDRNEILVRSTRLVLDLYRLNITYITTPCVTKQFSVVGMNSPRYFDFSPCIASFIPYLHIFETWHSRTSSNIPFLTENTSKHTEISFRGFWSSDFDLNISTAFFDTSGSSTYLDSPKSTTNVSKYSGVEFVWFLKPHIHFERRNLKFCQSRTPTAHEPLNCYRGASSRE